MSEQTLAEQVEELGLALQHVERELGSGEVPRGVLEDFRAAVDHTRMTLWAVIATARSEQQGVVDTTIARYRLTRTVQMMNLTLKDIAAGRINASTAELVPYRQAVEKTVERLGHLR
jgi:hypothetical protein